MDPKPSREILGCEHRRPHPRVCHTQECKRQQLSRQVKCTTDAQRRAMAGWERWRQTRIVPCGQTCKNKGDKRVKKKGVSCGQVQKRRETNPSRRGVRTAGAPRRATPPPTRARPSLPRVIDSGGGTQDKKMSKGHLPRIAYHQIYKTSKGFKDC